MRPVALGRRNWIHIGSAQAGPKIAAILSVVESCRRLKFPVRDYLAAVLPGLADCPINDFLNSHPQRGPPTVANFSGDATARSLEEGIPPRPVSALGSRRSELPRERFVRRVDSIVGRHSPRLTCRLRWAIRFKASRTVMLRCTGPGAARGNNYQEYPDLPWDLSSMVSIPRTLVLG